jgi:hypothetical protein
MSVTLPAGAPPPPNQRNVEYNTQPRLNADIAELHDTCDLTNVITYESEYAFAHGGFSDVYLGGCVVKQIGTKGIVVEVGLSFLVNKWALDDKNVAGTRSNRHQGHPCVH